MYMRLLLMTLTGLLTTAAGLAARRCPLLDTVAPTLLGLHSRSTADSTAAEWGLSLLLAVYLASLEAAVVVEISVTEMDA